jgi:hypothetical protein
LYQGTAFAGRGKHSSCIRARLSQAAENTRLVSGHDFRRLQKTLVLYQGTTSVVPKVPCLQRGFSPWLFFAAAQKTRRIVITIGSGEDSVVVIVPK